MKFQYLGVVCAISVLLTGCATIVRTNVVDFTINTLPQGATVRTSTGFLCTSPCTIKHPRRDSFEVTITKKGFQTAQARISAQVAGGGAVGVTGNVLIGGLMGIATDVHSGASKDLVPNPLNVTLIPEP